MGLLTIESRQSAERALGRAAVGCLCATAERALLAAIILYTDALAGWTNVIAAAGIDIAILFVAAWRFLSRKGLVFGTWALLIVMVMGLTKIVLFTDVMSLTFPAIGFDLIVLGLIVRGLAGAWALRRPDLPAEAEPAA